MLVLRQSDNYGFRVTQLRQCKARSAGNGRPLPRTVTPQWRSRVTPIGQGDKRPSAVLHSLALAMASSAVVRLTAERLSRCCIRNYQIDGALEPSPISLQRLDIYHLYSAYCSISQRPGDLCYETAQLC